MLFQSFEFQLLRGERWEAKVLHDFTPWAVFVAAIGVEEFRLPADAVRHLDLVPVVLIRMKFLGETLLNLTNVLLIDSNHEEIFDESFVFIIVLDAEVLLVILRHHWHRLHLPLVGSMIRSGIQFERVIVIAKLASASVPATD